MTKSAPLPLDYRRPGGGGDDAKLIARELFAGDALSTAGAWARLALGLPLCMIGPFFLALIYLSADSSIWTLPSFWGTFLLLCLILIPVLMWLQRRSRGKFMEDAFAGEAGGSSSYGELEVRGQKLIWTLYAEVALLGPRLVWSFIDWARDRQPGGEQVRIIAAEIAIDLYNADGGMQVSELLRPGRPRQVLFPALKYLIWHDWADLSSKRDRVWLRSPARKRMEQTLGKQ